MSDITYAEPYAGGAGAAINLLLGGYVSRILINDASVSIYSFWKYVKEENQRFIDAIQDCDVTLEEWKKMHSIVKCCKTPSFELAFATFFLSRTNRSGILNAGPIGGSSLEQQDKATYKIDCRFNKRNLAKRVEDIGRKKSHIVVTNKDAIKFLKDLKGKNHFVYLDPPYYEKGKSLYLDYYKRSNHQILAEYLKATTKFRWILSYDNVPEIRNMYSCFDLYTFALNYTAQRIKIGKELLTHSRNLIMPSSMSISRENSRIPIEKINYKNKESVVSKGLC
ncbi:MAG: DNA adenine methylase [Prevotella sp.]|nr:DNA adenine methylase [Prevotella sp.]